MEISVLMEYLILMMGLWFDVWLITDWLPHIWRKVVSVCIRIDQTSTYNELRSGQNSPAGKGNIVF